MMEYEVEAFVGHRLKHLQPQIKVTWKGYGADYDSWEPVKSLLQDGVADWVPYYAKTKKLYQQPYWKNVLPPMDG